MVRMAMVGHWLLLELQVIYYRLQLPMVLLQQQLQLQMV